MKLLLHISFLCLCTSLWSQTIKLKYWYANDSTVGLKKVVEVLEVDTNIANGSYVYFYQQGEVKIKGHFSLNKPTGQWLYNYESGAVKKTIHYKNDSISYWTYFYENGQPKKTGKVLHRKKDSTWQYFYENGQLLKTGDYIKNKMDGEWNYFYEDGQAKGVARYTIGSGTYTEYYYDGAVKMRGPVLNNLSEGFWTYYHQNGKIKSEGYESNGLKNGKWSYYYDNDSIASRGNFMNGKRVGDWKFHYRNGNLSSEGIMNNGLRDGFWKLYTNSGDEKGEAVLNNGQGSYTEFHDNGKVKIKGQFKEDQNDGKWFYYYPDGSLEGEAYFVEGKGDYIGYYQSGEVKKKGQINNGEQVNTWVLYNKDSTIAGYYKLIPNLENGSDEIVVGMTDNNPPLFNREAGISHELPTYKTSRRKTQYNPFVRRTGESNGWIVAANPFAVVRTQVPVSVEYFIQERLGHELRYTVHRDHFKSSDVADSSLHVSGFSIDLRQKFYGKFKESRGMFYFGHELRFLQTNGYVNVVGDRFNLKEHSYEYAVTVGNRLLEDINYGGLTLDFYGGVGVALLRQKRNFPDDLSGTFNESFSKNKIVPRPRLGFSIGYLF